MVYGVIFTHLVALFPAEIIQLNRQYEGSIILDIQPKVSFFLCKITNLLIYSNNPISINAQSSKNRTGYGNNYFYNTLIYEGTKYGETSQFPIVGYKISKIWNIQGNSMYYKTQDGTIYGRSLPG